MSKIIFVQVPPVPVFKENGKFDFLIDPINELLGGRENSSVRVISSLQANSEEKIWETAQGFAGNFLRCKFSGWRMQPEDENFFIELSQFKQDKHKVIAFVHYCESEILKIISKLEMNFEIIFESGVNLYVAAENN